MQFPVQMKTVQKVGYKRWITACAALLLCTGCEDNPVSSLPPEAVVARTSSGLLAPGNRLRISFSGAPELNEIQAIRADGSISLPLLGEVPAAGKKLKSFQEELTNRYKPELQNTQVIVAQEKSEISIVLSGAVQRPGKSILDEETTVLEAILEAGGVTNIGNLHKVRIIRTVNGKHYTQIINLAPAMQGKPSRVFYVKYGDIIYVPERLF